MTESVPPPRRGERPEDALVRLRRVLDLGVTLSVVGDIDRLLASVTETVRLSLGCEQAAVLLPDSPPRDGGDTAGGLRFAAATGDHRAALTHVRVPLEGSLAGACFRHNRVVLAADADADARHFAAPAAAAGVAVRSMLAVPMRVEGRPVGVLEALNAGPAGFDAADAETLLVIAAQAAVAVRNAQQTRTLREANARLDALDRVRADFVTVASHELRTPIAAIQGYAQALASDDVASQREAIAEILTATQRMADIAETLGEMVDLRSSAGAVVAEPVALETVVVGLGHMAHVPVRRTVDVSVPPVRVLGDARRLRLLFQHLLVNADTFTPPAGRVWIEADTDADAVTVRVCDTGVGLAAGDAERIFEPFVQADAPDTRPHEGLGVGLALARSIALRHGGSVRATSAGPGRGSTFHVRLPLAPA